MKIYLVHVLGTKDKCDSPLGCDQGIKLVEAETASEAAQFVLKFAGITNLNKMNDMKSANELAFIIKDVHVYELVSRKVQSFKNVNEAFKKDFQKLLDSKGEKK